MEFAELVEKGGKGVDRNYLFERIAEQFCLAARPGGRWVWYCLQNDYCAIAEFADTAWKLLARQPLHSLMARLGKPTQGVLSSTQSATGIQFQQYLLNVPNAFRMALQQ